MAERDTRDSKQIKTELDAANKKVDTAKDRLRTATPTNYDQLLKEFNAATKQRDIVQDLFDTTSERESGASKANKRRDKQAAKDTATAATATKTLQNKGEYEANLIQGQVDRAKKAFDNDPTDETKFATYQTGLGKLSAKIGEYASKGIKLSGAPAAETVTAPVSVTTATISAPPAAVVGAQVAPTTVLGRAERGESTTATPTGILDVVPTGGNGKSAGTGKVLRATVDKALKDQGLEDTPENRKKIRDGIKAGTQTGTPDTNWEPLFKSQYPQYAWMFTDEMKTKHPDLFQLFKDASADPEYDPNLFARRFDGSSWFTGLKASSKSRELVSSIGSFSWGSGNLAKFLTTAEQFSWTGAALKQEAYKELFRMGGDGKYVNPNAVNEVRASSPYLALKKIGTNFLAPMSDDRVVESLTGGISTDDVLRLARERAKAMYPHLVASIDAGLTLEDLAYDYKQIAAKTLERTPEQIDMGDGMFNVALKSGEGGKERMMSTGEWEQTLRTDPKYKFQETKQANRDAVDIGLAISRAFGRVGG